MGWEAVLDYHITRALDAQQIQIWEHNKEISSQKKDDRVQQISKKYVYPRTVDEFIADH